MPPEGIPLLSHKEILNYEEICIVVQAAAELGIVKVRLTGGEPLVRAGLTNLVAMLAQIRGIDDISLTTNAELLEHTAAELKGAGLCRINVSLDSLRSERFESITRVGRLDNVLRGIEAAKSAGLGPVKTNTVVIRGINDDEVIDFARLTIGEDWHVRFIEYMPFANGDDKADNLLVPIAEIKRSIETLGKLEPTYDSGGGPAKYFRLRGSQGTIGFISPVSEHFCRACNRLRLTADGKLRPCLFSDDEIDLRGPLRNGAGVDDIKHLIREAASCKPEGHRLQMGVSCERFMAQIGG
jgi:cyclic pyranopterin phosphate synthase